MERRLFENVTWVNVEKLWETMIDEEILFLCGPYKVQSKEAEEKEVK
jgi:hypothetical protein